MDAYAPIGPAIVTTDEIGDPHALGIRCFLNGASVQVRVVAGWLLGFFFLIRLIHKLHKGTGYP